MLTLLLGETAEGLNDAPSTRGADERIVLGNLLVPEARTMLDISIMRAESENTKEKMEEEVGRSNWFKTKKLAPD
jgi:hypothetical protein